MKTFEFRAQQFVPRPLGEVFSFFETPENLATITPPGLGFRIITPSPLHMREGAEFEYFISVMGARMRWKSRIDSYEPPHAFSDEQVEGPYRFWHHTHTFKGVDGGTIIIDHVRYAMPFGTWGVVLHNILVRRQLEKIFNHRAKVIERMFGGVQPEEHGLEERQR